MTVPQSKIKTTKMRIFVILFMAAIVMCTIDMMDARIMQARKTKGNINSSYTVLELLSFFRQW